MGGKWSKRAGWQAARKRMVRTEPAADGVGAVSQDLEKHGAVTSSNTGALDLSHFLKEKGGLEGLIYSQKRQEILDTRLLP
uniref:Protein Nef n=1 Tax=Human immunodeficiency virus type 1 TaxID=11676 RepID=B6V901_HV1|nr:truncated nef protein [Human immunodeficiency virus 1]